MQNIALYDTSGLLSCVLCSLEIYSISGNHNYVSFANYYLDFRSRNLVSRTGIADLYIELTRRGRMEYQTTTPTVKISVDIS